MLKLLLTGATALMVFAATAFAEGGNINGSGSTQNGGRSEGVTPRGGGEPQGGQFTPSGNYGSGNPQSGGVGDQTGNTAQMNDKARY